MGKLITSIARDEQTPNAPQFLKTLPTRSRPPYFKPISTKGQHRHKEWAHARGERADRLRE